MGNKNRKILDWIILHSTLLRTRKEELQRNYWWAKDICLCCISDPPKEGMSIAETKKRYPAEYVLKLGHERIYLCWYHVKKIQWSAMDKRKEDEI